MMMFKQLLLLICCAYLVQAQTAAPSLSGCHDHNGIEYVLQLRYVTYF